MEDIYKQLLEEIEKNPDLLLDPKNESRILKAIMPNAASNLEDALRMSNVHRTPESIGKAKELASSVAQQNRDIYGNLLDKAIKQNEPEINAKNFKERFYPELNTKQLSKSDLLKTLAKDHPNIDIDRIQGLFDPNRNEVYAKPKSSLDVLGHEYGHAYDLQKRPDLTRELTNFQDIVDDPKVTARLSRTGNESEISFPKLKKLSDIPNLSEQVLGKHHLGKEVGRELGFWEKSALGDYLKKAQFKALGALGGAVPFFSMLANEDADVGDVGQAALDTVNPLPSEPIESEEQKNKRKMVEKWLKSRPDSGT